MPTPPISPNAGLFTPNLIAQILIEGTLIGSLTLLSYVIGAKYIGNGSTMAFAVLSFSQLFHAFNMRSKHSLFKVGFFGNAMMNFSFLLCCGLQLFVITNPWLQTIFEVTTLTTSQWGIVILFSIAPIIFVELQKHIAKYDKEG